MIIKANLLNIPNGVENVLVERTLTQQFRALIPGP